MPKDAKQSTPKQILRQARNEEIIELFHQGVALARIAQQTGISKGRVGQIIAQQLNINYREILQQRKQKFIRECVEKCLPEVRLKNRIPYYSEMMRFLPGVGLGICIKCKHELLKMGFKWVNYVSPYKYTDNELLDEMRRLAGQLGRTPGVNDILRLTKYSHSTYYLHFGSMKLAQKAAGLKPNLRGHPHNRRTPLKQTSSSSKAKP